MVHAIDLEKQDRGHGDEGLQETNSNDDRTTITQTNSPESVSEEEGEELKEQSKTQSARSKYFSRRISSYRTAKEVQIQGENIKDEEKKTEIGQNLTATRTFSRREPKREEDGHHLFGGELSVHRMENALERFISQKPKLEKGEPVIVHWEGEEDFENPTNWSTPYKVWLTALAATLVLNSTFASSIPDGILPQMEKYFTFSEEVATLTISLWVAGYMVGPLIWGPLSERIGRKYVFIISTFMYTIWHIACALSKNTASILVFRFLGGVFGAAPLTNSGGLIADIWPVSTRGVAMSTFSCAAFAGPALGPIVSGAIQVTGTTWRWTYYSCAIFSGVLLILIVFTLKETYAPIILKKKAQRIRKETGQDFYHAPLELHPIVLKHLAHDTLLFPFIMLVQEPILASFSLYLGFVYGLVYLLFGAYPIIYEEARGFNALITGLMFLPFFLGAVAGCFFNIFVINPRYVRKLKECLEKGEKRVPPEERLLPVCIAAPCLVISFFWIGWTHYKSISFWCPMMGGFLMGFAMLLIFMGLFNYIVDAYLSKAASGLAGNTVIRSAFGAGFPLFTTQMFNKLGISWACSLLGFLALIMVPIPFVLVKFGPKIRKLSKHTADL